MGLSGIWHRFGSALRALRVCVTGAAAAEFAVIAPVMGLILTGTLDLAQLGNQGLTLDAALRAGASYAIASPTDTTGIECIIGQAVTCPSGLSRYATLPAGTTVTVTFTPPAGYSSSFAPPKYCACENGSTISPISCDNSVATCGSGRKHFYVRIQAVESGLTPLLPVSFIPTTITRVLTVRVL